MQDSQVKILAENPVPALPPAGAAASEGIKIVSIIILLGILSLWLLVIVFFHL
jgi:hypothetical protein